LAHRILLRSSIGQHCSHEYTASLPYFNGRSADKPPFEPTPQQRFAALPDESHSKLEHAMHLQPVSGAQEKLMLNQATPLLPAI